MTFVGAHVRSRDQGEIRPSHSLVGLAERRIPYRASPVAAMMPSAPSQPSWRTSETTTASKTIVAIQIIA